MTNTTDTTTTRDIATLLGFDSPDHIRNGEFSDRYYATLRDGSDATTYSSTNQKLLWVGTRVSELFNQLTNAWWRKELTVDDDHVHRNQDAVIALVALHDMFSGNNSKWATDARNHVLINVETVSGWALNKR